MGRSLTRSDDVLCHAPFLSMYLLSREMLWYTDSPVVPDCGLAVLAQMVAMTAPALNLVRGRFAGSRVVFDEGGCGVYGVCCFCGVFNISC